MFSFSKKTIVPQGTIVFNLFYYHNVPRGTINLDHNVPRGTISFNDDVPRGTINLDHNVPRRTK